MCEKQEQDTRGDIVKGIAVVTAGLLYASGIVAARLIILMLPRGVGGYVAKQLHAV